MSTSSIAILFSVIEYLDRKGTWHPYSTFSQHVQMYYSYAILASLALAIVGTFRDRNLWMSTAALLLGGFGLLVAATG